MAEEPTRVLFRGLGGLAWRQASDEERSEVGESWAKLVEKWQSEGVKFVGSWYGGQIDGFRHYLILEMGEVGKIREMEEELNRAFTGYVENFSVHVGWRSQMEPAG